MRLILRTTFGILLAMWLILQPAIAASLQTNALWINSDAVKITVVVAGNPSLACFRVRNLAISNEPTKIGCLYAAQNGTYEYDFDSRTTDDFRYVPRSGDEYQVDVTVDNTVLQSDWFAASNTKPLPENTIVLPIIIR